jgi:hypothetical protein
MTIGLEYGDVTLTATALGHQAASCKHTLSNFPLITAITPTEADACQSFQL